MDVSSELLSAIENHGYEDLKSIRNRVRGILTNAGRNYKHDDLDICVIEAYRDYMSIHLRRESETLGTTAVSLLDIVSMHARIRAIVINHASWENLCVDQDNIQEDSTDFDVYKEVLRYLKDDKSFNISKTIEYLESIVPLYGLRR